MKRERHAKIIELIGRYAIETQEELADKLNESGFSNSAKVRSLGFDNLSTYGIMKDYSKDTIRDLISFLIAEDYIKSVRR